MVHAPAHGAHFVLVFEPPSEQEGYEDCWDVECTCGMQHPAESREEAYAVLELHERLGATVVATGEVQS